MMGVSRSGYYKWKKRGPSETDEHRQYMIELVRSTHEKHKTHGYRWTAAYIRINENVNISDGYAYKCFRFLGIKAETLHKVRYRPRKERDKYPNLVFIIKLFTFKCYDIFYVMSVREHVYRTYSCDNIILANDLEVTCL